MTNLGGERLVVQKGFFIQIFGMIRVGEGISHWFSSAFLLSCREDEVNNKRVGNTTHSANNQQQQQQTTPALSLHSFSGRWTSLFHRAKRTDLRSNLDNLLELLSLNVLLNNAKLKNRLTNVAVRTTNKGRVVSSFEVSYIGG
jgi:hypothetical protein